MRPAIPLKRLVDPGRPITYGIVQAGEDVVGGVRYIRPVDMDGHRGVNPGSLRTTSPEIAAAYTRSALTPGDVVVSIGPSFGKTMLVPDELDGANLTQGTARVAVRPDVDARYIVWALQAQTSADFWETSIGGATFRALNLGPLAETPIPLPSHEQQRAIATYLDRETARIDTLIEEQRRLIEMLRERRQAVVDAAFNDLCSPHVKLRRHIKFLTSGSRGWGDYYADEGERFLRIGNMPRADLSIRGDVQYVDLPSHVTEGSRTILHEGDLLFSITAYLGSVAVVDGDWVGAYVSQHVALCRLDPERLDPRFIGWFMLTTAGQVNLREGAVGGTKMQLSLDDIKDLRVPSAAINAQRRIAAHLDESTAKIDALVAETGRFIGLANERRSALIAAAVTGEIDVREMT